MNRGRTPRPGPNRAVIKMNNETAKRVFWDAMGVLLDGGFEVESFHLSKTEDGGYAINLHAEARP